VGVDPAQDLGQPQFVLRIEMTRVVLRVYMSRIRFDHFTISTDVTIDGNVS
jgi:hypothetical protein